MASIRLWRVPRLRVTELLRHNASYQASWDWTPCNWRKAYWWMAKCLRERKSLAIGDAPVWCWHSCNGHVGGPPTVWTARALLSDYWYDQGVDMLTLSVP